MEESTLVCQCSQQSGLLSLLGQNMPGSVLGAAPRAPTTVSRAAARGIGKTDTDRDTETDQGYCHGSVHMEMCLGRS